MYSAFSAVMEDPDDPSTAFDADMLFELKLYDKVRCIPCLFEYLI